MPCCMTSRPSSSLNWPGDDFQQRGLAGAVAADQADALAGFKRKFRVIEQRDVAERELRRREGMTAMGIVPERGRRRKRGPKIKETRIVPIDAAMAFYLSPLLGYNCARFTTPARPTAAGRSPNHRVLPVAQWIVHMPPKRGILVRFQSEGPLVQSGYFFCRTASMADRALSEAREAAPLFSRTAAGPRLGLPRCFSRLRMTTHIDSIAALNVARPGRPR